MRIELINTGSELMLGRVLNTHQQWLCRRLADMGYVVSRQVAIADTALAIRDAVQEALTRADVIITTGGLGPTSDDLTREIIAQLLGRKLHFDQSVLAHIQEYFASRKRPMVAGNEVQAQVPDGAVVLSNAFGTAPGLLIELTEERFLKEGRAPLLIMLPGPPRELHPMFTNQVAPLLQSQYPMDALFHCRTLKTTGLGESKVQEIIAQPLGALVLAGVEIGYCARVGEVDVRFEARGMSARHKIDEAEKIVRGLIGDHIFGVEDDQLEGVVVRLLTERAKTLALAESCTGGYVSNRITNVPGASAVLWGGWITYANEAKQQELGVSAASLAQHGAVSEVVAREMAEGARKQSRADYAISVTGIAGPGGGTEAKPVGTVFIALATPGETQVKAFMNRFDRETFKYITSQQALEMLRRELILSIAADARRL